MGLRGIHIFSNEAVLGGDFPAQNTFNDLSIVLLAMLFLKYFDAQFGIPAVLSG